MDIADIINTMNRATSLFHALTTVQEVSVKGFNDKTQMYYGKDVIEMLNKINEVVMNYDDFRIDREIMKSEDYDRKEIHRIFRFMERAGMNDPAKRAVYTSHYKDEPKELTDLKNKIHETFSMVNIMTLNIKSIMDEIEEVDNKIPKQTIKTKKDKTYNHFSSNKSETHLTTIFNALVEKSFVSGSLSDWLFVFTGNGTLNSKICWTAKNSLTRKPSKISLLDFLVSMGFSENDIRANINDCFQVAEAKTFSSKDYSKKKDWKRDTKSEYHDFFLGIVK